MYFHVLSSISDTLDERKRQEAKEFSRRAMREVGEKMPASYISRAKAMEQNLGKNDIEGNIFWIYSLLHHLKK